MQNNISRMVMLGNIFLEIKLSELLSLNSSKRCLYCVSQQLFHLYTFKLITYPHKRKWREMKRALRGGGGGRGGGRKGFSDKLSGSADIGGIANIQIIAFNFASIFFTFCALYIDQ